MVHDAVDLILAAGIHSTPTPRRSEPGLPQRLHLLKRMIAEQGQHNSIGIESHIRIAGARCNKPSVHKGPHGNHVDKQAAQN